MWYGIRNFLFSPLTFFQNLALTKKKKTTKKEKFIDCSVSTPGWPIIHTIWSYFSVTLYFIAKHVGYVSIEVNWISMSRMFCTETSSYVEDKNPHWFIELLHVEIFSIAIAYFLSVRLMFLGRYLIKSLLSRILDL